jgi:hypothetical protein
MIERGIIASSPMWYSHARKTSSVPNEPQKSPMTGAIPGILYSTQFKSENELDCGWGKYREANEVQLAQGIENGLLSSTFDGTVGK